MNKTKKKQIVRKDTKKESKKGKARNKYFWSFRKETNKKNKTIKYYLDNELVSDKKKIDRLNKLYIPPAYADVIVSKSPNFKIQAIGIDTRGRKQYIYHPKSTQGQIEKKYSDIIHLGNKVLDIEKHNNHLINKISSKGPSQLNLPRDYYPIITMLLIKYHFRIGSHKYEKDNNSFGIITLLKDHIKLLDDNSKYIIEFKGKKGVINKIEDNNKAVYNIFKMLKNQDNGDKHIFCCNINGRKKLINPEDIKNYLYTKYNSNITPKMFRTWYANYYLLLYLKNLKKKEGMITNDMTKKRIKSLVKDSSIYVSSKLNNTPTISKKSYINPKILDIIIKNPNDFVNKIPYNKDKIHIFLQKII